MHKPLRYLAAGERSITSAVTYAKVVPYDESSPARVVSRLSDG